MKLGWILNSYLEYLAIIHQTKVFNFLPFLDLTKPVFSPKALQTGTRYLEANFRETSTVARVYAMFVPVAV